MDGAGDCARQGLYVLDGEALRPARSVAEWVAQQADADLRCVGYWAHVETLDGPPTAAVSTVFLGQDMARGTGRAPRCFESLVYWPPEIDGSPSEHSLLHYATWADAEAAHGHLVEILQVVLRRRRARLTPE